VRALVFLLLCLPAFAGETWTLYKGTTIVKPRVDYASLQACSDAAPKTGHTCRAIVPVPIEPTPTEVHMHAGIDVGFTGWPLPAMEFKTGPFLTAGNAIPPLSVPGDEGAFRTMCGWTLMAYHDPIVFPGQVGVAHHHTFYGNVNVGAGTTARQHPHRSVELQRRNGQPHRLLAPQPHRHRDL
jgi:hypothetical protein